MCFTAIFRALERGQIGKAGATFLLCQTRAFNRAGAFA